MLERPSFETKGNKINTIRNQLFCSLLIRMQPIILKKIPLGPKGIKMTNKTKSSSSSNILHSQMQTKKMAKTFRALGHGRSRTRQNIPPTQTFNYRNQRLKFMVQFNGLPSHDIISASMHYDSMNRRMKIKKVSSIKSAVLPPERQ